MCCHHVAERARMGFRFVFFFWVFEVPFVFGYGWRMVRNAEGMCIDAASLCAAVAKPGMQGLVGSVSEAQQYVPILGGGNSIVPITAHVRTGYSHIGNFRRQRPGATLYTSVAQDNTVVRVVLPGSCGLHGR